MSNESLTGCTSANFHEAGRSEYLAHYVFSSFGTSVPVPRQEDNGLDLFCTLGEREGQRLWPVASYCVQVKSNNEPWIFANPKSIQWIVEHPLPVFLCVVDKKSASLSIYHTSPRFLAWVNGNSLTRLEMVPDVRGEGYGQPWEEEKYKPLGDHQFPLNAPIAEFTITEFLESEFRDRIQEVLKNWVLSDRDNIFRIQAGLRLLKTFSKYETNDPTIRGYSRTWRNRMTSSESFHMLAPFIEQAKMISQHLASEDDWQGFLYVEMLLRHFNALNYVVDGPPGHYLYSQLRNDFPKAINGSNNKFYAGLDGLCERIACLTNGPIDQAKRIAEADCGSLEAGDQGECE